MPSVFSVFKKTTWTEMNEQNLRIMLEGGGGLTGSALRLVLKVPGIAYGEAMRMRRLAYAAGIYKSFAAAVPVVSVGNLTAGGSGKTPFVAMMAEKLLAAGKRPAILLRGYRAEDGLSDEGELYRTLVPRAIVVEGGDRVRSAAKAVELGADLILLDDGFQHLRLRRDLDIVLVDAMSPWGGGTPIPGGLLREPKSTLRKAGIVVVTRSDQIATDRLAQLTAEIQSLASSAPVFTARHQPVSLRKGNGKKADLSDLSGRKVLALCGIARPEAFGKTLTSLGAEVVAIVAVKDHAGLEFSMLRNALSLAQKEDALLVVTEKDAMKKKFADFVDNNNADTIRVLAVRQEVDKADRLLDKVVRVSNRLV